MGRGHLKHGVFGCGQEEGGAEGGCCPPRIPVNSERQLDRLAAGVSKQYRQLDRLTAGVVVRMGKLVVESHSAQYPACVVKLSEVVKLCSVLHARPCRC